MLKSQNLSFNVFTVNLITILSLVALFDGGFDHNIVYFMLILSLISLISYNCKYKEDVKINKSNPLIYLSLFIFWCGLSFLWSVHYTRSLIEFLQISLYGIVFLMTLKLDKENRKKVKFIVILIGSLIGFLGILEYILISSGRIVGSFTNPNPFATYLVMVFLLAWGLSIREKAKFLYVSSTILLTAILLTGSRGAFIALIFSVSFIFIGLRGKNIYRPIINTILLFIFSLLLTKGIMILSPIIQQNLGLNRNLLESLLRKNSFLSSSLTGRLEFWKVALKTIPTRPIIGYGLGSFFASYYLGYAGNEWFSRFTHNHYLQILSEIGIIGLILFLAFIIICFYHIYKNLKSKDYPKYLPGALAGIIAFLIHIGMEFSFNFPGVTLIFFYLLAISVGNLDNYKSVDILNNEEIISQEKILKFNYKFKNIIFLLLLLISIWHLSSLYLYEYSSKLIKENHIAKANKILTFTNSYYPINPVGYIFKSENYKSIYKESQNIEDLNKAIEYMDKAITRAPMDGNLYNKLGKLYLEKNDFKRAEENLILGVDYGIYPLNRYLDLANFYIAQNNYNKAEEILIKGSEISPYAIKAVGKDDRVMTIFNTALIHSKLFNIYKQENRKLLMEEQKRKFLEISKDYEVLRDYFSNIMETEL